MIEIGSLGLSFGSGNKGCEALAYSFLEAVEKIAAKRNEKVQIIFLKPIPFKQILKKRSVKAVKSGYFPKNDYPHLQFNTCFFLNKSGKVVFLNNVKKCKCVFDYTDGDSFTDIYGQERFFERTRVKKAVIDKNVPLILGSQTIGPFKDTKVRQLAVEVIKNCAEVYVRDNMSYAYTLKISGRKPKLTSDIAFLLPFDKNENSSEDKPKLGINPSGLLWNGGYTKDNQFGLTVNYREYLREVIKELTDSFEIHLIPHAFRTDDVKTADNDLDAVKALHKEFPETIIAPIPETPMQVKSYIASMDIFTGARMHATIGSFSAGIPVIPFSYSRKFEGLFESLDYSYLIHGKEDSTDEAVNKTVRFVHERDTLKKEMEKGLLKIQESNNYILSEIEKKIF
jgi:polysaccharide pyruvyl transferase WcaK-like protein